MSDVQAAACDPEPERGSDPATPEALVESYRRLAEVFHHVLSEQSLDTLLDRIADTLADLVPYDDLHIYEADSARRELVPVLVRSEWVQEIMRTRPAFGQGIAGWAVANREPVLANRAHLDPRVAFVPGTPLEPEALISIPLIARGSLKGALNIYRLGDAAFDGDEFELAKWFGDAAALALDNAQVRARLEHQAQTDSLTGLFNHRHFHERLRAELMRASRVRDSVALLMFDIDDFKRVNDICGHGIGDEILIGIGETILSLVRSSDVVCRIGGEEFAVIMPSCDSADALGLARRIAERTESRPVDAAGEVTLSIGIAYGPEHAMNPRELVACAESAMMTAKAQGKNRIVLFNELTSERPEGYERGRDARSIAHLKMLQSVAGRFNRLISVREIADAIVSELRMLIDYHSCRVYSVEGEEVVPIAVRGDVGTEEEELEALRVEVGVGVTGLVAATGRSMLVPNALECEQAIQIPGTEPVDESVIAVPLRYASRVNGVVFVSKLGLNQFDDNDLRLLEVLAGYAAVALENARLYDSLRREAEHAKAWLAFSDAMSGAGSVPEVIDETVAAMVRLMEVDQCSLWLQDRWQGDFFCAASVGFQHDPATDTVVAQRIPKLAAETVILSRKTPFVLTADELREHFFRQSPELELDAVGLAPLDPGYGIRGWVGIRRTGEDRAPFAEEHLRLFDGLAYRASAALQKALLYRDQQESAHVANALLEFASSLAEFDGLGDIEECLVERTAEMLGVEEVTLWLQDVETGDVGAAATSGPQGEQRRQVLSQRFPAQAAMPFAGASNPFILRPEEYEQIEGAAGLGRGRHLAIAPFSFDGGRMGFLVAIPGLGATVDELALKMLAGFADQAKLAIASAR